MRIPIVALLMMALVGLGVSGCRTRTSDNSLRPITITDARAVLDRRPDRVLVIDTRTPEAFDAGRIAGARSMRTSDIDLRSPDPALRGYRMIVVYGEDPGSSMAKAMAKKLTAGDYGDVRLLEGGFAAWRANGLPVER